MEIYRDYTIYEEDGKYAVGGVDNSEFEDCSLENLYSYNGHKDETEMCAWCMKHDVEVEFYDFRKDKVVSFNDYISHFVNYDGDKSFVVPYAYFSTVEKAKEFIDWIIHGKANEYNFTEEINEAEKKMEIVQDVEIIKTSDLIAALQESLEINGDLKLCGIAMGDIHPYIDINATDYDGGTLYIELAKDEE